MCHVKLTRVRFAHTVGRESKSVLSADEDWSLDLQPHGVFCERDTAGIFVPHEHVVMAEYTPEPKAAKK